MKKKTRFIILLVCAALFLLITPYIIFYSLGYRVDLKNAKVVATGGIYVRALPTGATITIDNANSDTTGIFSNAVFVQNLLPIQHSVQIKKDGYFDYQKNLLVKEKSVTKLEHVILFKKNITFEKLGADALSPFNEPLPKDNYVLKTSNLYPATTNAVTKPVAVISNVVAYKVSGETIIWLGTDGLLYSSHLDGTNTEKLVTVGLILDKKKTYEIFAFNKTIFLKENNRLMVVNSETQSLNDFYAPVNNIKASPNGQTILYFNDNQTFISALTSDNPDLPKLSTGNLLQAFNEKIQDAYWLNDDYVVFALGKRIMITETDIRGSVNTIQLPESVTLTDGTTLAITNPNIIFNSQEKKLYIQTGTTVLVSEKILP